MSSIIASGTIRGSLNMCGTLITETTLDVIHDYNAGQNIWGFAIPDNGTKKPIGVWMSRNSGAYVVSSPVYSESMERWEVYVMRNSTSGSAQLKGTLHIYWID